MDDDLHFHFVATRGEAEAFINEHDRFWVSNCGCREGGPGCERSRTDVCLFFDPKMGGTGSDFREVDRAFVDGILAEARDKRLVARPFRHDEDKNRAQGICFCCDDCCAYFEKGGAYAGECDRGRYVERTDMESCTHCAACVDVCYFGAREMNGDILLVDSGKCYGCALCLDVCPETSIVMVER
ncbi:MAG: 4Fe-4S binding protein [Candidatus Zixiibacteriota bacterium]